MHWNKKIHTAIINSSKEIESNTIKVGKMNTAVTSIDRSFRPKSSKETTALNDLLYQLDLQDIPLKNSTLHILLKCT